MADVAAATRVRATLVEAIEADHFEPCGGVVYARGHIRSIAKVVGADPAEVIREFDAAHHVEPEQVVAAVAAGPTDQEAMARTERRRPNWTMPMAAALVVICALALVGALSHGSSNSPSRQGSQQAASGQSKPHVTAPTTPHSPPPSAVAQLPSRATLLVRATSAQTWLSITTRSGRTLYEGLLGVGQHKVFTDRHGLGYVIGNAPGVDVVVNGNDIGSPPSSGSVARGSVVPGKPTVQQA